MSVTVDHEVLAAEAMGLETVGQVLSHVQRPGRLVVNLLIDGRRPDLTQMATVRRVPVLGRTLYIETVVPREMALDVLDEVEAQLADAAEFKADAADLLQRNAVAKAMEKLGSCFTTWKAAQESVLKVSQLLKVDLALLDVAGRPATHVLAAFAGQLRQIKDHLLGRDFVSLTDVLMYEMAETDDLWTTLLGELRRVAANDA